MAINLLWPRKDVYNAIEPFHWYLQYGAILFIGIVFFGGLAYYWFVQRHKTGRARSHRFAIGVGAGPEPAVMTRMFIDGEWRDATERRHRRGDEPGHRRVARPGRGGRPRGRAAGDRRGQRRLPAWARAHRLRARGRAASGRRRDASAADELARVAHARPGQAAEGRGRRSRSASSIEFWRMAAEDGKRVEGSIPAERRAGRRVLLLRRPRGVLGADHAVELALHDARRGARAGARVRQYRRLDAGPLDGGLLGVLAECVAEADLPPGVFNMVLGPGPEVGDELAGNPGHPRGRRSSAPPRPG